MCLLHLHPVMTLVWKYPSDDGHHTNYKKYVPKLHVERTRMFSNMSSETHGISSYSHNYCRASSDGRWVYLLTATQWLARGSRRYLLLSQGRRRQSTWISGGFYYYCSAPRISWQPPQVCNICLVDLDKYVRSVLSAFKFQSSFLISNHIFNCTRLNLPLQQLYCFMYACKVYFKLPRGIISFIASHVMA